MDIEAEYEYETIEITFKADRVTRTSCLTEHRQLAEKLGEGWVLHHHDSTGTAGFIHKLYIIKRKIKSNSISHT
jgi:hypothetical protein